MSKIIEVSESMGGSFMMTVQTGRGEEHVIDADRLVMAFVDFMSDLDNEHRNGWTLHQPWWEQEFRKLKDAAIVPTPPVAGSGAEG